jgi:hypothetical protein
MHQSMAPWAHVASQPGLANLRSSTQTYSRVASGGYAGERRVGVTSAFADPTPGSPRGSQLSPRGSGFLPANRRGSIEGIASSPFTRDGSRPRDANGAAGGLT